MIAENYLKFLPESGWSDACVFFELLDELNMVGIAGHKGDLFDAEFRV